MTPAYSEFCLSPYILKNLRDIALLIFPVFLKHETRASAAALLAPYGDMGFSSWCSSIGRGLGRPSPAPVDARMKFLTGLLAQASRSKCVPRMLVSTVGP